MAGARAVRIPRAVPAERSVTIALAALLAVAFVVRLPFLPAEGFKNDVGTFEAWALTLATTATQQFFDKAGFADYPPGYFFVLWFVGKLYHALVHGDSSYAILKIFVKMPALVADLVDAWLIFAIVRRFSTTAWALGAAAFFAFNPATIFISAYWGQVDSVAGALTLGAVLLVLDASTRSDAPGRERSLAIAWVLVAASILIKPPAVVLLPLLVAHVFMGGSREELVLRLRAAAYGIAGSLLLAYIAAVTFHAGWNPIAQLVWLYGRYKYASGVYPYTSVNAFNLYAIKDAFWQDDQQTLLFLPRYGWGIVLLLAATALVLSRYVVTAKEPLGFLEAAMILSFAYFVLLTRMHERYVFNAFMLAVPLIFYRGRYLYASIALTVTLFLNLAYSLYYLAVMTNHTPGVDPANLLPWISRPAALLNVLTFFYVAYTFLGATADDPAERFDLRAWIARTWSSARAWFAPLEGAAYMTNRDWLIGAAIALASFLVMFVNYGHPPEKIFDEIYYARAGEEYLSGKEIFEYTHPPLTKLIITASMLLFGGMHGGDNAMGWRFLNLIVGAEMVLVLYVFAKRLLGSTLFAAIAAGLLALDGFHFVQSRIATPEITVAFFSLLTLYAFYRFWLASRVRVAASLPRTIAGRTGLLGAALAAVAAAALIVSFALLGGQSTAAHVVLFLYLFCGGYLALRLLAPRFLGVEAVVSYAEGSRVEGGALRTFDGGVVPQRSAVKAGAVTTGDKSGLRYAGGEVTITYARDGSATYATPEGSAVFAARGTMQAGGETIEGKRDATIWMWALAGAGGALAASKWNGLFDFFVVWVLAGVVVLQPWWRRLLSGALKANLRPPVWGNPLGISLDLLVAAMLFVGGTIYLLAYMPYFVVLKHNFADMIALQRSMYEYHSTLTATHPYGSKWWQWPLLLRPISYYYHDFRTGAAAADPAACCVAEILALPNPIVWWFGLVSVPFVAWLAWKERNKGYAVLALAYLFQWLPWIGSPRVAFEYHFFPNLAVICLADAVLLQRIWNAAAFEQTRWPRIAVVAFVGLAVAAFVFWYPLFAGAHIPWQAWDLRMLHFGGWAPLGNDWV